MQAVNEILSGSDLQPLMSDALELLTESVTVIPGGVQLRKYNYRLNQLQEMDDLGVLSYNYHPKNTKERKIELRFCINNQDYCSNPACKNGECQSKNECRKEQRIDLLIFQYPAHYLKQFAKATGSASLSDELIAFKRKTSFSTAVNLCSRTRSILDNILLNNYSSALQNIYLNSQVQALLLYGLECLAEEKSEQSFACAFLPNEEDRNKMILAREILLQRLGEPITIKELSRKVGTNECYLKKGFKAMFGTTVFDFYQNKRMEHARYLLYEKGLSVTEVSDLLGYSSISHFSTAFKKHTGIKPCELLLR
jgi:AraC family transcriptional regulator